MDSRATGLRCTYCSAAYPLDPVWAGCPACVREDFVYPVAVEYDLSGLSAAELGPAGHGVWRWSPLLPPVGAKVTLEEGGTPVLDCPRLAERAGLRRLLLKDESRNPTWAHKDRAMAVGISDAIARGATAVTISSSGNAAISAAAYAARAGLRCIVFLSDNAPLISRSVVQRYGAIAVATSIVGRWELMEQGVREFGWYPLGGWTRTAYTGNPYASEGYKTIAYELWQDLGDELPDAIVVPTAGAEVIFALERGFTELRGIGAIERIPRLVAAEPAAGAPMFHALAQNLDHIPAVPHAETVATSIGASVGSYRGIVAIRETSGTDVAVTESEILDAYAQLARDEGIFAEPSAAAATAGALQLAHDGLLPAGSTVLSISSSGGLKDPKTAAAGLVEAPVVEPDFAAFRAAVREAYGVDVAG